MSNIYFIKELTKENIDKIFELLEIKKAIGPKDLVALKIHFGELGNTAYLKPKNVKPIVEKLKTLSQNLFFTDTNTLYKGNRTESVSHIKTAHEHGYDFLPVIIADGLHGHAYQKIKVDLKHFKEVYIGTDIAEADAMIALTHFKGHEVAGFGGAIKNISMGCAARAGKQQMHADIKPQVNEQKCTACGMCIKWCPTNTVSFRPRIGMRGKLQPESTSSKQTWIPHQAVPTGRQVRDDTKKTAHIDLSNCIGCAECVASCKFGAIAINWAGAPDSVQEKMAEYAYGAVKDKKNKVIYFNYILDVSPNCDCYGHNDPPVVEDIGILAGTDPVALDQASIDLVNQKAGKDIFKSIYPHVDWEVQLKHAEKIGLGKREYRLILI